MCALCRRLWSWIKEKWHFKQNKIQWYVSWQKREKNLGQFCPKFCRIINLWISNVGCSNATPLISAGYTSWRGKTFIRFRFSLKFCVHIFTCIVFIETKANVPVLIKIYIRELQAKERLVKMSFWLFIKGFFLLFNFLQHKHFSYLLLRQGTAVTRAKQCLLKYHRIPSVLSVWTYLTIWPAWTTVCTCFVSVVFVSGPGTKRNALCANSRLIPSTTV